MYRDRQVVWPTYLATGRAAPRLFRQTMRHELAVAMVSGRYLATGYEWARDRRSQSLQDHEADGLATKGDVVELIEVELTPKKRARYKLILNSHGKRMDTGEVSRVVYMCTSEAARVIQFEADKYLFRDYRARLVALKLFDGQGRWIDSRSSWISGDQTPSPCVAASITTSSKR
jgi:hypothetical protein